MTKPLTAEDVLPLVARLTPHERGRLLRLLSRQAGVAGGGEVESRSEGPPATDDASLPWEADDPKDTEDLD